MQTDRNWGRTLCMTLYGKTFHQSGIIKCIILQITDISMQDKFIYVPNRNTLQSRCLFPPEFKNRKGHRKSTRFRKKLKTNSSNQQSQAEDEDSSYTESENGDAAAQA
jgi:hypothetical protein